MGLRNMTCYGYKGKSKLSNELEPAKQSRYKNTILITQDSNSKAIIIAMVTV